MRGIPQSAIAVVRLLSVILLTGTAEVAATARSLPEEDPRLQITRSVMDAIVAVAGDNRTPPSLEIVAASTGKVRVAWYSSREHTVYLEAGVVDLCLGVGADSLGALAVLIGHELAHFYERHDWVGDFGNGFADLETGERLRDNHGARAFEFELEADLFGGLYGYMAGFNTIGVAPRLLEQIYTHFDLDVWMPGYPSLADRQEIARRSEARLRELVEVFDAGHHLLVIGENRLAAATFDYLARDFPSREILNNAGVAYARSALAGMSGSRQRFALPLEIDAETRLALRGAGQKGGGLVTEREVAQFLERARLRLQRAIDADAGYAPARINLACVYYLRGQTGEALVAAREVPEMARADAAAAADARIVEGICLADTDGSAATAAFTAALDGNRPLARLNLDALEGRSADLPRLSHPDGPAEPSTGRSSPIYDAILQEGRPTALDGLDSSFVDPILLHRNLGGRDGYLLDTDQSQITFVVSREDYDGTTARGIRVGASEDEVLGAYGSPDVRVASVQGSHWVYVTSRIAFRLDRAGTVRGWLVHDVTLRHDTPPAAVAAFGPRVALVIGNGNYREAPLSGAVNDAIAVGRALRRAGFEVLLATDVDRQAMEVAIASFGETLRQQGGVGLFYYSGHGVQVDGSNYLVPLRASFYRRDDIEEEYLPVRRLQQLFAESGNGRSILILDACRNVPLENTSPTGDGLASMNLESAFVAYATAAGKTAVDTGDGEHSVFTGALLRHMLTPGQALVDLFNRVNTEVAETTRGQQRPHIQNRMAQPFFFVPEGAQILGYARGRLQGLTGPGGKMVGVEASTFRIDVHEVTNAEFAGFLNTHDLRRSEDAPWLDIEDPHARIERAGELFRAAVGFEQHPVAEVTWHGARAYCNWYQKRLPTAAEWQLAATDGGKRSLPWGASPANAEPTRANFRQASPSDGYTMTAPVGSYPDGAAACGAMDMAGNVWEWVADADGDLRLALGASWHNTADWFGREQWLDATLANELTGFRCVKDR